jgi:hypothetical protein
VQSKDAFPWGPAKNLALLSVWHFRQALDFFVGRSVVLKAKMFAPPPSLMCVSALEWQDVHPASSTTPCGFCRIPLAKSSWQLPHVSVSLALCATGFAADRNPATHTVRAKSPETLRNRAIDFLCVFAGNVYLLSCIQDYSFHISVQAVASL